MKFILYIRDNKIKESPSARRVLVEITPTQAFKLWAESPSARRVLVEIPRLSPVTCISVGHPPRGGCWLKCFSCHSCEECPVSPSARRVLVEIDWWEKSGK